MSPQYQQVGLSNLFRHLNQWTNQVYHLNNLFLRYNNFFFFFFFGFMYFSSFLLFNSRYGKKSYLERQILQEKRKLKKKRALTSSSIIKKKKKKKKQIVIWYRNFVLLQIHSKSILSLFINEDNMSHLNLNFWPSKAMFWVPWSEHQYQTKHYVDALFTTHKNHNLLLLYFWAAHPKDS